MRIVKENLDIMNIFKKIYKVEKIKENDEIKETIINMSEECKK